MQERAVGMGSLPFEVIQKGAAHLARRRDAQDETQCQRLAMLQCPRCAGAGRAPSRLDRSTPPSQASPHSRSPAVQSEDRI